MTDIILNNLVQDAFVMLQAKVIKGSLLELMETYKENSAKINSLSNAAKEVISSLPDVPKHLSTEYKYQSEQYEGLFTLSCPSTYFLGGICLRFHAGYLGQQGFETVTF